MSSQEFSASTNEESKPHFGDIQNVNHNPNNSFTTPKLERTQEDDDYSNSAIVEVESSNPTPNPNPNPNIICEGLSCIDCHAKLECPNCHAHEFNNSKGGLPDIAGFRFNPTDEELIVYYLKKKVRDERLPHYEIREVELYKHNPDDLTVNYNGLGGKQWYFFTPRDRKYKNGTRPNRAAGSGYWKATGADKPIHFEGRQVGHRKALVFYYGKAPKGDKTNWIMHEYRVDDPPRARTSDDDMRLDDWVLCRIYKKDDKINKSPKQNQESSPNDEPNPQGSLPPSPNNGNKNLVEIANPINHNSNNIIVPQVPATHVPNYSPGHLFMQELGVPSSFGNFSTHYETNFSGVQHRLPPVFQIQNPMGNIYDQNADCPLQNLSNLENIEDYFISNGYDQMGNLESLLSNNVLEGNFKYHQQQRDSKGL